MTNWLSRLFKSRGRDVGAVAPDAIPVGPSAPQAPLGAVTDAAPADPQTNEPASSHSLLTPEQAAFLEDLVNAPEVTSVDGLSADDRAFVAGVQKRWRKRELELPVMPAAAIRLSQLLREGGPVGDYVALLENDPALSVELLRVANSAIYASTQQIRSLHEAVVRIGLARLQAILMTTHLRARVLKGGAFKGEAELLLDLALPMGFLASRVARNHASQEDTCFMRGVLMHVEHLVILSSVQEVSRDLRRMIRPSPQALHHAIARFGRDIREAIATAWSLTDLLMGAPQETGITAEYGELRRALVWNWMGRPLPTIEGVDAATLATALADLDAPGARGSTPRRASGGALTDKLSA